MGIRCSLLGHDYGESFVERDREERGNEVVVTERELQECRRCGAEKVTSENTEVRSIEPEPDRTTATSSTPDAASAEASDAGASADDTEDAFTSATEVIEQAEAGASADAGADTGRADPGSPGTEEADDASGDDDAVILDDDASDAEPGSDQWDEPADPEVDPEEPTAPTPDPEEEDVEFVESGPSDAGEPATGDTDPAPDDATTAAASNAATGATDADQPPAADETTLDRDHGEWPDHDGDDEGFDAQPGDADQQADRPADAGTFEFGEETEAAAAAEAGAERVDDTQFTSAGPVEQADADGLDFALYCPECGFERYAAGSSLRAGDICPECKRGYLAEDR